MLILSYSETNEVITSNHILLMIKQYVVLYSSKVYGESDSQSPFNIKTPPNATDNGN